MLWAEFVKVKNEYSKKDYLDNSWIINGGNDGTWGRFSRDFNY